MYEYVIWQGGQECVFIFGVMWGVFFIWHSLEG
jgi:hypothetical protein